MAGNPYPPTNAPVVDRKTGRVTSWWLDFFNRTVSATASSANTLTVLTADPASPQNDTAWVFRDGGVPQAISLRLRIAGVTYDLPLGTIG